MKADVSQMRRIRLIMEGIPTKEFHVLDNATKLRTIIFQKDSVFPLISNKSLRAVHHPLRWDYVGGFGIEIMSSSNFKFKHLRHLDLLNYYLEDVHAAESIHQLYNLQTLTLPHTRNVQNILTEGIGSLINLRHLDLSLSDAKLLPDSITRLTNLQFLNLSCTGIKVLPTNIGHLQNLSSLNISITGISELPDSLCLLRNLTKFDFSSCIPLKSLPRNFGALTQLRSLDLTRARITELPESLSSNICKLEFVDFGGRCKFLEDISNWVELRHLRYSGKINSVIMPRGIEKLTCLEVLEPFLVSIKEDDVSMGSCSYNSSSSSVQELSNLNSLQFLQIANLENVRGGKIEAEMAKLKDKQNIQYLQLEWNFIEEEEEMAVNNSATVLEGLQPHPNLKAMGITAFPGLKLPKWMGSSSCLPNLVELYFIDCESCTKFVGLGQLPCLQSLWIWGMDSVKCLGKDFYHQQQDEEEEESKGSAATTLFPSLTLLEIKRLKNLEEWSAPPPPHNSFPCLEKVKIKECPNLTSLPDLRIWTSSLRNIYTRNCEKLEKEAMASYFDKYLPSVRYTWGSTDDGKESDNSD